MKRRTNNIDLLTIIIFIVLFFLVCTLTYGINYNFNDKKESSVDVITTTVHVPTEEELEEQYNACLNKEVNEEDLPDNIKSIINEINDYYKQSDNYISFKYYDITTGFSVGVNEHQATFAASAVKAPAIIYYWNMVSQGKIDLNEKLIYTSNYLDEFGYLKTKPFNTEFTTRELINYTIRRSDNAAHNMLFDRYGKNVLSDYWKEKGLEVTLTKKYTGWGDINAHDAVIYMNELYKFYTEDKTYGEEAMSDFINTTDKFLKAPEGYQIANKGGWYHETKNDVAIVLTEQPYIVVALSNLGSRYNGPYFKDISNLTYKLHTEYWNYKTSICNNIKDR